MEEPNKEENRPTWDQGAADKLVGATVLIGITYHRPGGAQLSQFFGSVTSVDAIKGITLRLRGTREGETFTLPPDVRSFLPAQSGSYRLRETGEIIDDPDYTATWDVNSPA